jgi:hypothetical protein
MMDGQRLPVSGAISHSFPAVCAPPTTFKMSTISRTKWSTALPGWAAPLTEQLCIGTEAQNYLSLNQP